MTYNTRHFGKLRATHSPLNKAKRWANFLRAYGLKADGPRRLCEIRVTSVADIWRRDWHFREY